MMLVLTSSQECILLKNVQTASPGMSNTFGEVDKYENCSIQLYNYDVEFLDKGEYKVGLYIKGENGSGYVDLKEVIVVE